MSHLQHCQSLGLTLQLLLSFVGDTCRKDLLGVFDAVSQERCRCTLHTKISKEVETDSPQGPFQSMFLLLESVENKEQLLIEHYGQRSFPLGNSDDRHMHI